jgi:hypothetical protein
MSVLGGVTLAHARRIFDRLIQRNVALPTDHAVRKTYFPLTREQSTVTFSLFKIDRDNTRLASDPALVRLCTVSIPVSGVGKPVAERRVTVTLRLAQTRIVVTATDDASGASQDADIAWRNVL